MKQPAANTNFPLLQSAMMFSASSGSADTKTNETGVTVRIDPTTGNMLVTAPSLNITDLKVEAEASDLNWARTGFWGVKNNSTSSNHFSPFVFGYETPLSSIPTSGSATYSGTTQGFAYYVENNQAFSGALSGKASFTADFGARTVNGSMTDMKVAIRDTVRPWNNVAFNAGILADRNGFSGSTSVTSAPGGTGTLPSGATGTIEGRFYGPAAQEAGAVWTLHAGDTAAVATIKGSRP